VKKINFTCAIALIGLMLGASGAQAFQFSPISKVLTPSGAKRRHEFKVTNEGGDPIAVEFTIRKRAMDEKGEDIMAAEEDDQFIIYPAQTIVGGGKSKRIRVEWIGDPDIDVEQSYRIIAEQVPVDLEKRTGDQGANVQVMLKYVGSLYVRSEGMKSQVLVRAARVETVEGKKVLTLETENVGARHTILKDPVINLGGGVELVKEDLVGLADNNILARTKRTFSIPLPAKLGALGASLFVPTIPELTYRESD
jgi:fimbrial chaperone protein